MGVRLFNQNTSLGGIIVVPFSRFDMVFIMRCMNGSLEPSLVDQSHAMTPVHTFHIAVVEATVVIRYLYTRIQRISRMTKINPP